MPTGYTAELAEKGQKFDDFVLQCARAFGACIEQRDDPMSDKPRINKPSNYHVKARTADEKQLAKLKAMSKEEKIKYGQSKKAQDIKYYHDCIAKIDEQNQRINNMISKVSDWNPPTPEHDGLKKFMLEQLNMSIETNDYYESTLEESVNKTPKSYYDEEVQTLKESISYHKQQYKKECANVDNRNKWIQSLYKSLEKVNAKRA